MSVDYAVVIPTVGRDSLRVVLNAVEHGVGPPPREIIVVDDRPEAGPLPPTHSARVLRSGGRGPAAARNAGWRAACCEWVAFLDDDVVPPRDWKLRLTADLAGLGLDVGASQARIVVPLPEDRRPTDWERGTAGLADARWITADMAYRRAALVHAGGFDERFPRAYREDAELALRVQAHGYRIVNGDRVTTHPVREAEFFASLKQQRGNADDALVRRLLGPRWRERIGGAPGRLPWHVATTGAGGVAVLCGLLGWWKAAVAFGGAWAGLTGWFAARRIAPGPQTRDEVARMVVTSLAIPPAACWHRLRGEVRHRAVPVVGGPGRGVVLVADALGRLRSRVELRAAARGAGTADRRGAAGRSAESARGSAKADERGAAGKSGAGREAGIDPGTGTVRS
ncbi:glycosyltransferase family 2 protein [Saccharothrix luteola]|uniref:glycosyltransferase family 2 protein n=1 Tax=Saccharothrix luteola TaxID=2893018 RepID=UPI001E593CB0|nr:glycosyltransferase [Saccharothrix luteola]MCC8248932.1 glycosyltransferase [Saccharothrix luteola]